MEKECYLTMNDYTADDTIPCEHENCKNSAMHRFGDMNLCDFHLHVHSGQPPLKSDLTQLIEMMHEEVKKIDGIDLISFSFHGTHLAVFVHLKGTCRMGNIHYDKLVVDGVDQLQRMIVKLQKEPYTQPIYEDPLAS